MPARRGLLSTGYCLLSTASVDVSVRPNHRVRDAASGGDGVGRRVLREALERGEERAQFVAFTDGRERVAGLGLDALDRVVAEDAHHVEVERRRVLGLACGDLLGAQDSRLQRLPDKDGVRCAEKAL